MRLFERLPSDTRVLLLSAIDIIILMLMTVIYARIYSDVSVLLAHQPFG